MGILDPYRALGRLGSYSGAPQGSYIGRLGPPLAVQGTSDTLNKHRRTGQIDPRSTWPCRSITVGVSRRAICSPS